MHEYILAKIKMSIPCEILLMNNRHMLSNEMKWEEKEEN